MDISYEQVPDDVKPIQPTRVESVSINTEKAITIPDGHSLVQPLDSNGEDKGMPFLIANRTYKKVYKNNPNYKLLDQTIKTAYYESYIRISTEVAKTIHTGCSTCGK